VRRRPHWDLRARLVVAFVGVALLAAVLATVYSSINMDARVAAAAQARLQRSVLHFSGVAAVVYEQNHGWTAVAVTELHHLARIDDLAVLLGDGAGGTILRLSPDAQVQSGASATAPVMSGGRNIGRVTVSQANGRLLTAEEAQLRQQLNRMHLVAGVTSAAIAFAIGLYLALTLSRPLRRIRTGAEAMGAGDLDVRVKETGDDEIRAVARALNGLAETLQREEELRKESVADLAHELRTPVMGLLARVEAAQDGVFDDEAANLAAMHDESLRLTRLLDDLSALADAERPGLLLSGEPVDLSAIAAGTAEAFRRGFADKGIELTTDLQAAVVAGDRKRLEQVVVNLLTNALRYTDAGGHVSLSVRQVGGSAVLEVADSGVGIPPEDLAHVFTRFWRGEKSRSRATGGAGIGLSIVKELVRAHGGQVTVESTVGQGAVFRVVLPCHGATPPH
jgi:two-component system, OmpR family, sensor histidine kinase BaeS